MRNVKGIVITVVLAMALVGLILVQPIAGAKKSGLEARVAALEAAEALSQFVRVEMGTINGLAGPHLVIEGANLHILSGSGSTDDSGTLTGLGNLLVGYNEEPSSLAAGDRGGSHNLIVGQQHKYSSFGGFVAGFENSITGPESSVSGGEGNVASGLSSSVSGGVLNGAIGPQSSVSGGTINDAIGPQSSVSGGGDNIATGGESSVSGGGGNQAMGAQSSVSGGGDNTASGNRSSVSGGEENNASVPRCWKAGTGADTC